MNAGDTLDFGVGDGGNGYAGDTTGLQAVITTGSVAGAPEPGSLVLASGAVAMLLNKRLFRLGRRSRTK